MTKKDYIKIADTLKKIKPHIDRVLFDEVIQDFSNVLYDDNSRFDYSKFESYIKK